MLTIPCFYYLLNTLLSSVGLLILILINVIFIKLLEPFKVKQLIYLKLYNLFALLFPMKTEMNKIIL